jgi:hypothetical protein
MAQAFPRVVNTLFRSAILGTVLGLAGTGWVWVEILRSPYVSRAGFQRPQPVPYSHETHVGVLGMDCRYCHATDEKSASAGIPSTKTCMACHSQIFSRSPVLEPVRSSFEKDRSIAWTRVHDLPDFVRFDHSIHVNKGVGCSTCHGRVDQMPLVAQGSTLHMEWCLACHRHPESALRPQDRVFDLTWRASDDQEERGAKLASELAIDKSGLEDCSVCHQ